MRLVLIALAGLLFVTACGKKAPLRPPPPRDAPAQETPAEPGENEDGDELEPPEDFPTRAEDF